MALKDNEIFDIIYRMKDLLLTKMRKENITSYTLAKKLDIEPQAVYQWIKGLTLPCKRNRLKIIKILDIDERTMENAYHTRKNDRRRERSNTSNTRNAREERPRRTIKKGMGEDKNNTSPNDNKRFYF